VSLRQPQPHHPRRHAGGAGEREELTMNASARSNTHRPIDSRVSLLNSAMSCLKWIRSTTHNVAIEYRRAEGQNDRLRLEIDVRG
jgi:hypothetical protein